MSREGLVTVIVPIYKVENYLNRCVESIAGQTYEKLEIILVDDGSPDQCPQMCDEWAQKDARVKVIHKENGGLSDARNAGMRIASGEYTMFVDSDDWIHEQMIEILLQCARNEKAEIVECKAEKCSDGYVFESVKAEDVTEKMQCFATEESMQALLAEMPLHQTVWNKLYKTTLMTDIAFAVGKYHEDEFWTYQVFAKAEKIVYIDVPLYAYFQRTDSIMGNGFSAHRADAIEGRYQRYCYIEEHFPTLATEAKKNLFFLCLYYEQQALRSGDKENERIYLEATVRYIDKTVFTFEDIQEFSSKELFWIRLAKLSYRLCAKVRNRLGVGVN